MVAVRSASGPGPGHKAEETDEEVEARRNAELKQTLATMQRETGEPQSVSGAVLSDFVAAQSEIFLEARAAFQAPVVVQSSEFTASDLRQPHEQRMEVLNQRIAAVRSDGKKLSETYGQVASELERETSQFNRAVEGNAAFKASIRRSNEVIQSNKHTEELVRAIEVRDSVTGHIEAFTRQCQAEMREWQERIAGLRAQQETDGAAGSERLQPMLDQYQAEWDRVHADLAGKSRTLLKLRTEYDRVPSIAELTQYDRRLTELTTLQNQKFTDLKKCHQLLSALVESEGILAKENELFNSVLKTFNQALNQGSLRNQLLSQMSETATQTQQKKQQVTTELKKKQVEIAELDEKHRKLLEGQRRYFQAVKEYQNAYEILSKLQADE
jgi:hypothetical protein